ncbi:MAG TPA: sulfate ABC transporter substrate-binding protein [Rhodocyclaceae bacterium]|nr:sulfate ABC transporter substrate-binding protein [Rhodocyclaceae bacterium]
MNLRQTRCNLMILFLALCAMSAARADVTLLNVSYDPTREMYAEYNVAFAKYWKAKTGETVNIKQTHGTSSKQATTVEEGLEADVVTLAMGFDVENLAATNFIAPNWSQRLPHDAAPYTSTIAFLVRKGNPKNIRDWSDLVRFNVDIIIPSPKTAGAARWGYLAAWGYVLKQPGGTEEKAREFTKRLYANTKGLEYGARGAANTFTKGGRGDVLVTWENEALKSMADEPDKYEIVYPSISILAEPPVAVVDKMVDKHGTRKVAEAYLQYLYTPAGQEIAAKNFYRPTDPNVMAKFAKQFPPLKLFKLEDFFTNWQTANKMHFQDGGTFDKIYDQARVAS